MEQRTNYIVYLCYGNEGTLYECAYSLLSLSRLYKPEELANTEIWIYTDEPDFFKSFKGCKLPLHYRLLDQTTIKEWRGKVDFAHRIKLEMLREFTTDRNGIVFYLDSDTVFLQRIDTLVDDIKNEALYMHVSEGIVGDRENPIFRKLDDYLRENSSIKEITKPVQDLVMWNAGMLGFDTWYRYLLDKALAYTDSLYPKFSKHIVEQFALSIYFQQEGEVKAAAPYILHYWSLKEARGILRSFFEYYKDKNWDELTKLSNVIQMQVLMQEKISYLNNRTFMQSMWKRQWRPSKQDWATLEKQL